VTFSECSSGNPAKYPTKMPKMVTNTSASVSSRLDGIGLRDVAWFALFVLAGSLAILHPLFLLSCVAVAVALGFCWVVVIYLRREDLELWQGLVLIAVSGYMLLNYGFENLALHVGGFPIIISYGLMYAALALAVFAHRRSLATAIREPAIACMLGLFVLALLHLAVDIPSYGLWAIRDSTMCLDGLFMLLGLFWAMKAKSTVFLTKWLLVVFVLNLIYSFTRPWGEQISSWSPKSGVFLKVSVLGNYNGIGDVLFSGTLFCICLAGYVMTRPRWMMLFLAIAQFIAVAISQVRRMYVAAVVVLLILVLLGEIKKFAKLFILVPLVMLVIVLVTTLGGIEIPGRIGVVNLEFFKQHIRSISDSEGTPGSSVESRFKMADEAFQHFLAHPVVGEGFGLPLLTEMDENNSEGNNAVTRMPHNSSLSYLARMGTIGFAVWIAFHFCLIRRFSYAIRQRAACEDKRIAAFVLWLFLFYVLFMIGSLVEAPFEFPSGAVPFYFLMGFALGLIRWNLSGKRQSEARLTA
jgi:O-antigen ligase